MGDESKSEEKLFSDKDLTNVNVRKRAQKTKYLSLLDCFEGCVQYGGHSRSPSASIISQHSSGSISSFADSLASSAPPEVEKFGELVLLENAEEEKCEETTKMRLEESNLCTETGSSADERERISLEKEWFRESVSASKKMFPDESSSSDVENEENHHKKAAVFFIDTTDRKNSGTMTPPPEKYCQDACGKLLSESPKNSSKFLTGANAVPIAVRERFRSNLPSPNLFDGEEQDDNSLPELVGESSGVAQNSWPAVGFKTVSSLVQVISDCFEEEVTVDSMEYRVKRRRAKVDVHEEPQEPSEKREKLELNPRPKVITGNSPLTLAPEVVDNSLETLCYVSPLKRTSCRKAVMDCFRKDWDSDEEEEEADGEEEYVEVQVGPCDSTSFPENMEFSPSDDIKNEEECFVGQGCENQDTVGEVVDKVVLESFNYGSEIDLALLGNLEDFSDSNVQDLQLLEGEAQEDFWSDSESFTRHLEEVESALEREEIHVHGDEQKEENQDREIETSRDIEQEESEDREIIQGVVEQDIHVNDVCGSENNREATPEQSYADFVAEIRGKEKGECEKFEEVKAKVARRRKRASVYGKRRKPKKDASPKSFEIVSARPPEELKSILRTASRIRRSARRTLIRSKQRKNEEARKVSKRIQFDEKPEYLLITPRPEKRIGVWNMPDSPTKTVRPLPHLPIDPSEKTDDSENSKGEENVELAFTDTNANGRYLFRRRKPRSSLAIMKTKTSCRSEDLEENQDKGCEEEIVFEKEVFTKPKRHRLSKSVKENGEGSSTDVEVVTETPTSYSSSLVESEKDMASFSGLVHVNYEFSSGASLDETLIWRIKSLDQDKDATSEISSGGWDRTLVKLKEENDSCNLIKRLGKNEVEKALDEIESCCGELLKVRLLYGTIRSRFLTDENSVEDGGRGKPWPKICEPNRSKEFLENAEEIGKLKSWLKKFRDKGRKSLSNKSRRRSAVKNRRRSRGRLESDSVSDDSDEDEEDRPASPVAVLCGPRGCGKTSLVHILGSELGFTVMELHSGDFRSGSQVKTELKGALDNHRVRPSQKTEGTTGGIMKFFATSQEKESRRKSDSVGGLEVGKEKTGMMSVILLDDVDILFEKDEGFWPTVRNFAEETRVPMILTCGDERCCDLGEVKYSWYSLQPTSEKVAVRYLQIIGLAAKSVWLSEKCLLDLYRDSGYDLRKSILQMQCVIGTAVESGSPECSEIDPEKLQSCVNIFGNSKNSEMCSFLSTSETVVDESSRLNLLSAFDTLRPKYLLPEFSRNSQILDGLSDVENSIDVLSKWENISESDVAYFLGVLMADSGKNMNLNTCISVVADNLPKTVFLEAGNCLSCDYSAYIWEIAEHELERERSLAQRRYQHYFDRINLDIYGNVREASNVSRFFAQD